MNKEYYQKNKERINKVNLAWKLANPGKVKKMARDWYNNNLEKSKQSSKDYYAIHKDQINGDAKLRNDNWKALPKEKQLELMMELVKKELDHEPRNLTVSNLELKNPP